MRMVALIVAASALVPGAAAWAADGIDTSNLTLVSENHAELTIGGVDYVLDSYIVLFQRPYYIRVIRDDGKPIEKPTAIDVAREYIETRGCTDPLERRPQLDQKNSDESEWLIGIAC